jgi:hypothetical protein
VSEPGAVQRSTSPAAAPAGRFRLDQLRQLRERVTAQLVARDCLRHYQDVCAELPRLSGHARYREVLARQARLDPRGIDLVIVQAERLRTLSGQVRCLDLRDIARALATHRCLRWRSTQPTRMADCSDVVAREIPEGL